MKWLNVVIFGCFLCTTLFCNTGSWSCVRQKIYFRSSDLDTKFIKYRLRSL